MNNLYIKSDVGANQWVRPSDWLPMPTGITSANQTFVGLNAVFEKANNYVSFSFTTSAGQYQVDWGNGVVTLHNSGTIAQYQYDYSLIDVSTLTSRGYKQVIIKVTPVSGNLTACNFQQRFVTSPVQNQPYGTGFLDCILSMPNATSIVFGGTTVKHTYVERFEVKTIGSVTNLSSMFAFCYSLQSIPLLNTANVTNMASMFNNCYSLQSIPLFNTANVTNLSSMFASCFSLQSIPLLNTANVTNLSSMFAFCYSLQSIPLFNTANVTNMTSMFASCFSLQSIPLLNTANVTNMASMFNNCYSLQSIPFFNTANVTNMASMFASCYSLQSIPNLTTLTTTTFSTWNGNNSLDRIELSFTTSVDLSNGQLSKYALVEIFTNLYNRTATTSATINITGNWGASALTAGDRLIATSKNWVITG